MARYPGFVGPSYTSRSKSAAADRCVNWFPEKIESGTGAVDYALYPTPGWQPFCTLGATPIRPPFFTLNGATFVVAGGTLYELPSVVGGDALTRSTAIHNPDNSRVSMAGNGDAGHQLLVASGSQLFCFDLLTDTGSVIADIAGSFVAFLDGYFIALDPQTSTLNLSALEDGTTWDALDAIQRNDVPDKWIAMIRHHKELWLFGLQTTSVYYNGDDPDFPFVPNPSVFIPYGISAPQSAANVAGAPMWLGAGEDGANVVLRANGYQAQRVSTHAVEYAISTYATVSDAEADVYQEQGHVFYRLSFPTAGATWVYDATTGLWCEEGAWNGLTFGVVPVTGHAYANGRHLVGNRTTGAIYQQSMDYATTIDGSTGIRRLRRAPHLLKEKQQVVYDRFELHLESGLGLATGQGSDPQVMLRWSDDGGESFGDPDMTSAGAIGEYLARPIWYMLGQGRDRVFEVSVSDPIPWRVLDAYLQMRPGRS